MGMRVDHCSEELEDLSDQLIWERQEKKASRMASSILVWKKRQNMVIHEGREHKRRGGKHGGINQYTMLNLPVIQMFSYTSTEA
jgi:hypothetical protein